MIVQSLLLVVGFNMGINYKHPKLVYSRSFEMNRQQTYRDLKVLYWMNKKGTLVYNNSHVS